jgi:hexosaminidase
VLNSSTGFNIKDKEAKSIAKLFNEFLNSKYGLRLRVRKNLKSSVNTITFSKQQGNNSQSESYTININSNGIQINSSSQAGYFYALQTILQLLPKEKNSKAKLPAVEITDYPKFKYRGMHLDVARHYFPPEFIKKFIDTIAAFKFNYFHWHLTDDQGWRIEIKKYPRLTQIGSYRNETVVEKNFSPYIGDNKPVSGFYTQREIREIVKYAQERFVTVIPEIEMPGHASAALAAYPQFGCKTDYKYKVQTTWGIFKEVFCPYDATFSFLEDILTEVIDLFPDAPYIHIGGDEVLQDHWKESSFVQELKKNKGLKNEHEVQSYFVQRIEKFVNSKGKKIIGWDEILDGGIAPNAVVMSWRGMKGGVTAANSGHDVIMTPTDYVYLDYGQGDPQYEPFNIGNFVPLEKVYSFNPIPKELSEDKQHFVIGGQGNIWTEYMKDYRQVEYMAFPRALALAEVLWSGPGKYTFAEFNSRLNEVLLLLDQKDINYRIPEPIGLRNIVTQDNVLKIDLDIAPHTQVRYTLDGTQPTIDSRQYTGPISVNLGEGETKTLSLIVINNTGRASRVYTATLINGAFISGLPKPEGTKAGLSYSLSGQAITGEELRLAHGLTRSLSVNQFQNKVDFNKPFSVEFKGLINVNKNEVYSIQLETNAQCEIIIDNVSKSGCINVNNKSLVNSLLPLEAGFHSIHIALKFNNKEPMFRLRFGQKGQGLRQLYGGEFIVDEKEINQ